MFVFDYFQREVWPVEGEGKRMAMTFQGSILNNGSSEVGNSQALSKTLDSVTTTKYSPVAFQDANEASNSASENGTLHSPHNGDNGIEPSSPPHDEPNIEIIINNVVCTFSVKAHLNLREIAQNGFNVEYRRENGVRLFGTPLSTLFGSILYDVSYDSDGDHEVTEALHNSIHLVFGEDNLHRGHQRGSSQAGCPAHLAMHFQAGKPTPESSAVRLQRRERLGHLHNAIRHQDNAFLCKIQRRRFVSCTSTHVYTSLS